MSTPIQRCTVAFIVRIWAEYLDQQPPTWRGAIEMCEQYGEMPFVSLEDLLTIIQEKTIQQLKMEDEQ